MTKTKKLNYLLLSLLLFSTISAYSTRLATTVLRTTYFCTPHISRSRHSKFGSLASSAGRPNYLLLFAWEKSSIEVCNYCYWYEFSKFLRAPLALAVALPNAINSRFQSSIINTTPCHSKNDSSLCHSYRHRVTSSLAFGFFIIQCSCSFDNTTQSEWKKCSRCWNYWKSRWLQRQLLRGSLGWATGRLSTRWTPQAKRWSRMCLFARRYTRRFLGTVSSKVV